MPGEFRNIQKIKENPQGTPINESSFVKFKIKSQSDDLPMTHQGQLGASELHTNIEKLLFGHRAGQIIQYTIEPQQKQEKKSQKHELQIIEVEHKQLPMVSYQEAEKYKLSGNSYIKQKNYIKASEQYEKGYQLIEYESSEQCQPIKTSLMSNLTLAYLNTKKFEKCIEMCDNYNRSTLEFNKKIIYRRASASKGLGKWEESVRDATLGRASCQDNEDLEGVKDFEQLIESIKQEKRIQQEKQKKVYGKMFG